MSYDKCVTVSLGYIVVTCYIHTYVFTYTNYNNIIYIYIITTHYNISRLLLKVFFFYSGVVCYIKQLFIIIIVYWCYV